MKYMNKLVDLDSGKPVWVDLGEHRTISEVSDMLGIGARTFRQVLLAMDLLQREWDVRAQRHRNRLAPWAVNSRLGMRHDRHAFEKDPERTSFDVLSPEGVEYIRDHLEETYAKMKQPSPDLLKARAQLQEAEKRRRRSMDAEEKVSWLVAHHVNLTQGNIAAIAEVSERLVRRYIRRRERQLAEARDRAARVPLLVRGVPAAEVTPGPLLLDNAAALPAVSTPRRMPMGEPRDAWERGELDRSEARKAIPLWAPDRIRKSPRPLWEQTGGHPDEQLLQVA